MSAHQALQEIEDIVVRAIDMSQKEPDKAQEILVALLFTITDITQLESKKAQENHVYDAEFLE